MNEEKKKRKIVGNLYGEFKRYIENITDKNHENGYHEHENN